MSLIPLNLSEYYPPETARSKWKCGRSQVQHRSLTLAALIASGFQCVACGKSSELTVHHLTKIKGKRDRREIRCIDCHLKVHGRSR